MPIAYASDLEALELVSLFATFHSRVVLTNEQTQIRRPSPLETAIAAQNTAPAAPVTFAIAIGPNVSLSLPLLPL